MVIPPELLDLDVLARACPDGEDGAADGLEMLPSAGLITLSPGPQARGRVSRFIPW